MVESPYFSSVSLDFDRGGFSWNGSKMDFFRYFGAVPFDHIFERKLKFSAAKSKSGVASFRTKVLFFWLFWAPETAHPLFGWGKKSRLSRTVESLASFLIERPSFWSKLWEILRIRWLQNANFFDVRVNVAANVSVNVSEIGEKSACPVIFLP